MLSDVKTEKQSCFFDVATYEIKKQVIQGILTIITIYSCFSLEIPHDSVIEVHHGVHVTFLNGVYYTVVDVTLENQNTCVVDGGTNGGELYKNFRTVTSFGNHIFDGFKMTDRTGKTVDN